MYHALLTLDILLCAMRRLACIWGSQLRLAPIGLRGYSALGGIDLREGSLFDHLVASQDNQTMRKIPYDQKVRSAANNGLVL